MMRGSRRSALCTACTLALAAALAPALASRQALAVPARRLIAPPTGNMTYTRAVTRSMVDGAHITVTRSFAVEFREFAGGFMLHGRQVSAEVEAPAVLARFAELERARDESALFPIPLDAYGQILEAQIAPPPGDQVRLAVEAALRDLVSQPLESDTRTQLAQFVSALQQASQRVTAVLPADLFAPAGVPRREEQRIALPGGGEGLVATLFEGECDLGTGLMRAAARQVTTVVGDSERSSHERWSLG